MILYVYTNGLILSICLNEIGWVLFCFIIYEFWLSLSISEGILTYSVTYLLISTNSVSFDYLEQISYLLYLITDWEDIIDCEGETS